MSFNVQTFNTHYGVNDGFPTATTVSIADSHHRILHNSGSSEKMETQIPFADSGGGMEV